MRGLVEALHFPQWVLVIFLWKLRWRGDVELRFKEKLSLQRGRGGVVELPCHPGDRTQPGDVMEKTRFKLG